ncbi:MAG: TIGR04086 family membrane protein [Eubacteriales bacterium]|nr:TIGR04086 family membrane protein [Eubacteriales bacterium]
MKYPIAYISQAVRVLKALLVSYVLTGLLLLATAGLLYRFRLDEGKVRIAIILTYILSCFAGGFLAGKMMKSRKFLWGVLLGFLYFAIMLLVSVAVNRQLDGTAVSFATTLILCILGGMMGGMCA